MDIEPQNFFQILRGHSNDVFKGPSECFRLLTILNYNLTEEQLSSSHIDLYLLHMFDKSNGLFNFVLGVASNSKFDPATVKSLEIIYTLINNFSSRIEQYILDINEKCLKIVCSNCSAKVKAKALDVLIVSFEKVDKCLENQEKYRAIFGGIESLLKLNHPDSVKQKEFIVLGLFMKKFSYLIDDSNSWKKYFMNQLDKEMVKGFSQGNVYGIFTGFGYLCESFPLSLYDQEDAAIVGKLYKHINELSVPKSTVRIANRAAILFFGDNIKLFIKLAIKEFKRWHKKLLDGWLGLGAEDRKVGEQTLNAYLLAVSETLLEMNKSESLSLILDHFIKWLKHLIRKQDASHTEKKLAIQGLKYFCSPLYRHYPKEEAREVFLNVMQTFERNYILNENSESEEWEFLPVYIQCLASFMRYQSFTTSELYCLQRAVISMIKTFHKLKPLHHLIVIEALITTFFYLKKTVHLDGFLENIIYQGVVWSCSHQHITDSDLSTEQQIIVTVKDYFPLWRGLLKVASHRSYDKYSIYLEDRKYILTKIVNELVKTLMILINKLNVNVKLKEDVIQTDIEKAYQVEQTSDFSIFLNVTDFYQEIFNNIDPAMFRHCICKMINHLVAKCFKYPLVSGFYKLLSFALKIANSLKLFVGNISLNQDVTNCKETLSKFIAVLLYKMKQFKDELLISSLQVLLESPVVVVEPMLPDCTGIFISIFEVGRSYIALANMGLSTLELWQDSMGKDEFETFLEQVIPCLDSYLRSKSLGGIMQTNTVEKKRKTAQALKKRTVLVELEPELVKFQKRILHFVGSQNSKICQAFVSPDNNFERKVTSDQLHLKVALPYDDLTLEVHLEPFVLRVVELSLYCSDRKTRVMACELLQAVVMVFLGRAKQIPNASLSDLDELLKNIAMPLLQLSCDIDQVVKQIFEPLMKQLIHWYTSKINRISPHLAVLITVLMEGVTHPTNSALRDFSGECLNEFVKWTIKQHSASELRNDPSNIKVLVKRIRFFSGHPDLVKKLGAALIFNYIYKEIREERALISIFSMELLHIFIMSLSLLETSNEEVENTVLQITNAIRHLKRVFVEKPQIFREKDDLRRVPSDIRNGDLTGLSKWLLTMTASRSKHCRDIAMELFVHIQPLSGNRESLSQFVEHHFQNLPSLYEAQLTKIPTLEDISTSEDCTAVLKWLQAFLCSLDGLIFMIKNSICSVNLEGTDSLTRRALDYFLEKVYAATIEQALKLVFKDTPVPYFTAVNKEQYLALKASCCLAILKLASAIANDQVLCEKSNDFWNNHFWKFILNVIFNPATLGLDDRATQPKYLEVLELLLNIFPRKLKENKVQDLVTVLRRYVGDNFDVEIDLKRNVSQKQRNILKGLLMIQRSQINNTFRAEDFSEGLIDKLMNNFYNNIDNNAIFIARLSETTFEHCSLILKFALCSPGEYKSLLSHIYKDLRVTCQELSDIESQSLLGVYFLSKFGDVVVKFIVDNFEMFLEGSDNLELIIKLSTLVLVHLEKNKREFGNAFGKISNGILTKWFLFQMYFEENSIDSGLDFIRQLWKMFGRNLSYCEGIPEWLLSLIMADQIIMTEQEDTSLYLNIFTVLAEVVVNDDIKDLGAALEKIKSKLQPAISSNSETNTLADKFLTALPTVKSQTIFKFLIEFYVDNVGNVKSDIDLTYLLKHFMSNNSEETHEKILQAVYELALEENKTFEQKKILADNVLPPVFKNSNYAAFERFFAQNINQMRDGIKNMTDNGNGIVNFLLVEMLFLRIPIGVEGRMNCAVTEASGDQKLRTSLLKLGLDAFKSQNNEGNNEHSRLYKCGAYKTLASIISNSIKSEKLYEKLFVREENSQDILWNALIDSNVTYSFPVDFDSYPKKRKILVNIRDELREQAAHNRSKSFRYIASQRLFNSSLSEDVTKFDFTNTVLRANATNKAEIDNIEEDEEHAGAAKLIQGELYLEATEINNHELMGTVCGTIDHIFKTGICQLPEDDEEMVEFPQWMEGIRNLLLNPSTAKNVKIFWVKVIDNMIYIFRHFAKYFIEPLLQFLNDKVAGSTINYFVTDVIVILASWTAQTQPSEKEARLASDLLQHIITNLSNERKDAFKYNLDLIKLFVENWREHITVPYDSLFAKLNFEITDRKIEVGIHLTSIFLVNRVLPCEHRNINVFCKKLVSILRSTVTSIYKPCSETVGLMLKYFKMKEMEQISLSRDIGKIILGFEDVNNKYAGCLEGVAIHYPDIVDTFHLSKIFNRLPQSNPSLQTTFLKIMLKRADVLNDVIDFKSEDWVRYLGSQNAEVQLLTLEILLKTFQHLKEEKSFKDIVKGVCKNLLNPNVFCRGKMYDILMAMLENGEIDDHDVCGLCKEVLIQGLVDTDIEIREKIRTFWSENPMIPSGIATKFSYLMSNFYLAKAEEHFLGYASYFLLDSIKSEDYEKELFEHPLEVCDFEEYKLQTNWRLQHPSVVPMFAETLRTYTEGSDDGSLSDFGAIRATQNDNTFAPTQQTLRERHISQVTSLETSLMGATIGDQRFGNDGFINPNAINMSEKYKLPKRRFLKDKTKISASFAHHAVDQKIQKAVKRYEAVKEREKRVTIYRSYRKGDLPDIQITLGSLIKPLQMLVLHDSDLSKTLFTVLYKTLSDKVKNSNHDFTDTVLNSIKRIFTTSVQFNVNVFSTLVDILLKSKDSIRLDPGLISTVCQQSGLISVGALLIEEYLISWDDVPGSSKRGSGTEDVETRYWLKLAELYKELHEWNLVRTIFLEKSNCKEEVHQAIILESGKRWREAHNSYEQVLKVDRCLERQDFYFESCFKCLAHLGEWEQLPKGVDLIISEPTGNTWNSLWDNDWLQQKLLPWYIGAQVKNMLFSGSNSPQFLMDINNSLGNAEQAEHLKNKFSEELCILWLTQKDTAQATQYLKSSLDNFLSEWQLLNPMFGNLRYNKVLSLRNLIEIDRFLECELKLTEDSGEENLKSLEDYWKSTQEEFLPSIVLNEAKLLYRRLFIKLLSEKSQKINQPDLAKGLKKTEIMLDISFMNTAIEEENYYMTRKYFRQYMDMKHPKLTMIYGNLAYLYSYLVKEPGIKLEKLFESLQKFRGVIETSKDDSGILSLNKFFDITQKVMDLLTHYPDLYTKYEKTLSDVFGSEAVSPMDVAFGHLKTVVLKTVDANENRNENLIKEKTKALVKLAYFIQDEQGQEEDFVLFVLRAMQLGSKEARQLFPCILLQDSLADDLKELFVRETESIPTWMFLGWIPQLLANVDSPKVTAISKIVLRIAKTYPQAIMYSYRLSKENYSDTDISDEETTLLIDQLDKLLLCDPMVDKFLTGLSKINVPLVTVEYYRRRMLSASSMDNVIKIRDEMLENIFKETSDSRDADNMQGNMYKQIKDLKKDFLQFNSKLLLSKSQDLLRKIEKKRNQILIGLTSKEGKEKFSVKLQDYCPWLANFSAGRMNLELEIPGQYSGDKLPLVQHHVKISGFCETVSIMSSLRRPIKVTMLGMDSKEYPFLLKFGEDIRQDQRIQQLFILMNNIFASDNKTHRILTYEVIPLTTSLGIIQWVENTTSLDNFIRKSTNEQRKPNIFETLSAKYKGFFEKNANISDSYGNTARNKNRIKVIPFYKELVHGISWDVLRTSIWSMSLTTESFIAFRNNFIKSYAAICACHWILGIGDRHLENSKVCTKNGKVLGIDFGHAFGTGTQILPIPELVPIRLTPHLVGLMEPLKEKGSFRDVMIDCIKSLRENRGSLLATMNVFIQEPSVDWLDNARRFQTSDEEREEQVWYPLQKVDQAKRKLEGTSSSVILIEDLQSSGLNRTRPQFVKTYVSLVEGDPQHDLRARLRNKEQLSVEEQVDSLIDHATDPNLLGRMYSGWSPYV